MADPRRHHKILAELTPDLTPLPPMPPAPGIAITDTTVTEGSGPTTAAQFTVSLSQPTSVTTSVSWASVNGTAKAPTDFVAPSGTVAFLPGESTKVVSVAVKGDRVDEVDEAFTIHLSTPVNARLVDADATGRILDDDLPNVTVKDLAALEGNTGSKLFRVTVPLSSAATSTVYVDWAARPGFALAGSDYVARSGTLVFPAGTTSLTADVTVKVMAP